MFCVRESQALLDEYPFIYNIGGGGVMSEGVHLEWGILHFVNTAMSVIKISEFSKWVRLLLDHPWITSTM